MVRLLLCIVVGAILLCPQARAERMKLVVAKTWKGSVDDEKLMKGAPEYFVSADELNKVWKAWKIEGDAPKIDFSKNLVIAVYSRGSRLNLAGASLDEKGNLQVLGFGTRDLRPGFRYVFGLVPRKGVVSVNGKKVPTE